MIAKLHYSPVLFFLWVFFVDCDFVFGWFVSSANDICPFFRGQAEKPVVFLWPSYTIAPIFFFFFFFFDCDFFGFELRSDTP
jgi:hypothetical protein